MKNVIDRAAADTGYLQRLIEDPLGVARAEGYDVTPEQVLDLLRLNQDFGKNIQDMVQVRLSQLAGGKWL